MILTAVFVYFIFQLYLSYWVSKRVATHEDFVVAGRSVPTFLLTFSLFASWFGAETCIGTSAAVFSAGLSGARADPFGYSLCLILLGLLIAPKFWEGGYLTLSDMFSKRFHPRIEKMSVFVLIPSSIIFGAAQIRGFGQVISSTTNLPVDATMTFAFLFSIFYTLWGGLLGDILTDFFQSIIITIGLLALLYFVLNKIDVNAVISQIDANRLSLVSGGESFIQRIERWSIPVFGSLVALESISRIVSAKSMKISQRACFYSAVIYIFMGAIPVFLGLIGPYIIDFSSGGEGFIFELAKKHMPEIMLPVFIGALLSAIIAVLDTIWISSSTVLSQNLLFYFLKPKTEKQKIRITKITIIFVALIAYFLALNSSSIYNLVQFSSSLGTSGVLVITVMGLWTNFGALYAPALCLLVGLFTNPIAEHIFKSEAPFLWSLGLSFATFLFVSLFDIQENKNLSQVKNAQPIKN